MSELETQNLSAAGEDPIDEAVREPVSCKFSEFVPITEEQVRKIIMESSSASCSLDPLPTWLLKLCVDALTPFYTHLVNLSLSQGYVPTQMKEAILIPLLKKLLLDPEILKHFRPVSNLPFISKVTEKVVAKQVNNHMTINKLHELLQSAYKTFHSTETVLLRVENDLLLGLDDHELGLLVLIDLSAAFDTVNHKMLLDTLKSEIGLDGTVLNWFSLY